jgi:hypothetical protein
MRACFSKFLCKRREVYAEVYSQAYSQSFVGDDYLAKQKYVPSSTSFLSSNEQISMYSADSDDAFSELVSSVDLIQLGSEQRTKTNNGSAPLISIGNRTVTSIEGQELDIETLLEDDGRPEVKVPPKIEDDGMQLDPMDYHVVSKHCARSKRRLHGLFKNRISPLLRVKQQILKSQHFDMIVEDFPVEGISSADESVEPIESALPEPLAEKSVIRSLSSTSAMYIETDGTQSFDKVETEGTQSFEKFKTDGTQSFEKY